MHLNFAKACAVLESVGISTDRKGIKDRVSKIHGGNGNFRSVFDRDENQQCCLKIPRSQISSALLDDLDSRKLRGK